MKAEEVELFPEGFEKKEEALGIFLSCSHISISPEGLSTATLQKSAYWPASSVFSGFFGFCPAFLAFLALFFWAALSASLPALHESGCIPAGGGGPAGGASLEGW